jgi:PPM family protein phosphatase
MELFRRIFGKSSDEVTVESKKPQSPDDIQTAPVKRSLISQPSEIGDTNKTGLDTAADIDITDDDVPTERVVLGDEGASTAAVGDDLPLDPITRPVAPPIPSGTTFVEGVTQPLNPDILTIRKTEHLAFGQSSDVGLVRNNNQDAALSFYFTSDSVEDYPDIGLFVVADGMGGHHDGEKASAITTRILASQVVNTIYLPIIMDVEDSERIPTSEALVKAVKMANEEVIRHVPEGGTTVTAVVVIGDLAHLIHVGDSRAYLMTNDRIEQITRDHSLVQRLIELDQLTPEEAEVHPQKNVLYRALGQNETLEVDAATKRLPPNSRLLICSDGLWGQVEEKELYEVAMNHADPQQACDKLVALANTRGGSDNITAILLKIS